MSALLRLDVYPFKKLKKATIYTLINLLQQTHFLTIFFHNIRRETPLTKARTSMQNVGQIQKSNAEEQIKSLFSGKTLATPPIFTYPFHLLVCKARAVASIKSLKGNVKCT